MAATAPVIFTKSSKIYDKTLDGVARQAGVLHDAYMAELLNAYGKSGKDSQKFSSLLVSELAATGVIDSTEQRMLDDLVVALHDNTSVDVAVKKATSIARQIDQSSTTGSVAKAVANIGLNSIQTVAKEKSGNKGTAAADLGGALTGANIGSKGGIWGGILGAIVCGVGMSYLAKRDQKGS